MPDPLAAPIAEPSGVPLPASRFTFHASRFTLPAICHGLSRLCHGFVTGQNSRKACLYWLVTVSRLQGGKYTPPPPCRAVASGRRPAAPIAEAVGIQRTRTAPSSTTYPPSSHRRPAWQFLHSSFCLLPSPSRVAPAPRRQEEHPARRRVNPLARTPALRQPGSWSQCMRKIERRLPMNLGNMNPDIG